MKPTEAEVAEELQKLREMAPRIRQESAFGDDNRAKIDAQIAILSGERRVSHYEPDSTAEEYEDSDEDLYRAAQDAEAWKERGELCEGELISAGWLPLVLPS